MEPHHPNTKFYPPQYTPQANEKRPNQLDSVFFLFLFQNLEEMYMKEQISLILSI